jgi:hypothetical protein
VVRDSRLRGGTAITGGALTLSTGATIADCGTCVLMQNYIEAGTAIGDLGVSTGLLWNEGRDFNLFDPALVLSNVIRGGEAIFARGLVVNGDVGGQLRVLHNNIFAGGNPGAMNAQSIAIALGVDKRFTGGGADEAGVYAGNIIDVGVAGGERIGFLEACGNVQGQAKPGKAEPTWARNNDFWPNDDVDEDMVYARTRDVADQCSGPEDVTELSALNSIEYLAYGGDTECTRNYAVDPAFKDAQVGGDRDGVHIEDSSPLVGQAVITFGCPIQGGPAYPAALPDLVFSPLDIDGDDRRQPADSVADIGADELSAATAVDPNP